MTKFSEEVYKAVKKIPRGETVEYGIMEKMDSAKRLLDNFCRLNNLELTEIRSTLIPSGLVEPVKGKIAFCGDSIGMTKPWSGGSILWNLNACQIFLNTFPNLQKYKEGLEKFYSPKMFFSRLLTKVGVFTGDKLPFLVPKEIYMDSDWIF